MRVTIVRNRQFAVDVIAQTILFHARVEINTDYFLGVLLKCEFFARAAEGLINLQVDGCGQRSHVGDTKISCDGRCWHSLLPQVLELKLGLVELEDWSDEITEDDWAKYILGLAVVADYNLALPRLRHLTGLGRVSTELDHDTHLGIEDHSLGDHCKDELCILFTFLLLSGGLDLASRSLVLPGGSFIGLLIGVFLNWLDLTYPGNLHLLTASVFKEELFGHDLVSVLSSEVNVLVLLKWFVE